jgi:hypothetical protein
MALLDAVFDVVRYEYEKLEPVWKTSRIVATDREFLENECSNDSEFDPFGWRKQMYDMYLNGNAVVDVRECAYGRVVALGLRSVEDTLQNIPWGLWGRILRLYYRGASHPKAKIFFLASPYLRTVVTRAYASQTHPSHPSKKYPPIGPENINGGYTYHCNMETIVIYRAEDATRVLIHELQHASCLDHMEHGVDIVEAETEAWAELLYAGLLSQGKKPLFHELVKKQADWMQAQNAVVKRHIHHERQFPWRYTVGKEEVWERWGLLEGHSRASHASPKPMHSLRLTPPPSAALKRDFGVESNIL